jgi:hypothetical protein
MDWLINKLSHSTVNSILKGKDKYLREVKKERQMQTTLIRKCHGFIPELEILLIMWTDDQT